MSAQNPSPGSVPPYPHDQEQPVGGPPGYAESARASPRLRTALFTTGALVVGLGAGVLIAMPSNFGDKPRTLSEEYDVEVVCQYTNEIVNLSHEEIFNSDEPYYHHQEALTPLITALLRTEAGSELPPHLFGHPYDPGAETDAVNFDDVLETVQEFCNSRN